MARPIIRLRLLQCIYGVLLSIWGFGFLILNFYETGLSLHYFFQYSSSVDQKTVRRLMSMPSQLLTCSNQSGFTPLSHIFAEKSNALHYYHLPKRKTFMTYTEVTTANRDTRFPLAPDFTFHIRYNKSQVTLYEDYGPGCIYRIYLFPPLSTNSEIIYKMTSKDLAKLHLIVHVDGLNHRYSVQQIMEGKAPPFLSPINTQHASPASGMGSYVPFCYQQSMTVYYVHDTSFPENLFQQTVNCTANELRCPVKLYSSISRHKYPTGTQVTPFSSNDVVFDRISDVARLLKSPESHGPDSGKSCDLQCVEVCAKCQRVIFHRIQSAGVISSMKFRVFETDTHNMVTDWNGILLTAYFDVDTDPQIHRVPLGILFGATSSLNDFNGAAFGRRSKYCSYADGDVKFPREVSTGYFYLPMPYWDEALIVLEGSKYLISPLTVCYQVSSVKNYYVEMDTAYLHMANSYFGDDTSGWRSILNVSNGWGHVVSVTMEIDNLRAIRDVPLAYRWAMLQADNVIYVDGSKSPTVMGTGLEDYFSYAHGFSQAENTSYAFVGVYHAGPKQNEPLSWHCYRQHILDPIPFRRALRFVMEGTDSKNFMKEVKPLSYHAYRLQKLDEMPTVGHLVIYYYRPNYESTGSEKSCDVFELCNRKSEIQHRFIIKQANSNLSGMIFKFHGKRYVGDSANDRMRSGCGRSFVEGDSFQFVLSVSGDAAGKDFVLSRTFHSDVFQWNDEADITVNDVDLGKWFIPMGPLSEEYSIRQEDLILPRMNPTENNGNSIVAVITVKPLSRWQDLSYRLCVV